MKHNWELKLWAIASHNILLGNSIAAQNKGLWYSYFHPWNLTGWHVRDHMSYAIGIRGHAIMVFLCPSPHLTPVPLYIKKCWTLNTTADLQSLWDYVASITKVMGSIPRWCMNWEKVHCQMQSNVHYISVAANAVCWSLKDCWDCVFALVLGSVRSSDMQLRLAGLLPGSAASQRGLNVLCLCT